MKGRKNKSAAKKPIKKTRKEIRKDKRQQKKISRALHYSQKSKVPGASVLINNKSKSNVSRGNDTNKKKQKDELQMQRDKEAKKMKKLANEMEKRRKNQLKEANEQEDKVIKQLEKQLKLNKRKSKSVPKSFAADGLDYLLEFCNVDNREMDVEMEKQLQKEDADSDFERDFAVVANAKQKKIQSDDESLDNDVSDQDFAEVNSESSEDLDEIDDNSDDSLCDEKDIEEPKRKRAKHVEEKTLSTKKGAKAANNDDRSDESCISDEDNSDDEKDGLDDLINADSSSELSKDNSANKNTESIDSETWEDIYGRKRDKDGNILAKNVIKYTPPGARLNQLENDVSLNEKVLRLKKQLKGCLNRLAEHNMHTISIQIEELYMANSRNDMNEMLSTLMLESIVSPVMTPDRLIAEHMVLIAILHANVGTEVGAHFLLSLVKRFDKMIELSPEVENKELDNIILMISHLYNFKVYGSNLLYQILGKLTKRFTEKEIELILIVLKTVGFLLRKDDPVALKELVLGLQQKAADSKSENSRIKFMLDVLLAIKNNNMSKIPQYDPYHVQHLKKIMHTFLHKGNVVTQLNISLEDLLDANEKGKWWVIGSAWSGNSNLTKPQKFTDSMGKPLFSQKIADLARKQRMNTDTRRNIFGVLMTADDYMDAFEKLHHLGLKDHQAREILYVIMDCCLQEKKFNPYYAVLAQKFCDYDRKNQMTLQCAIWDKLKMLDTCSDKQLTNLSKFVTHLVIEKGLSLSVLKVVNFGELNKSMMRLTRQILLGILLHENPESCVQVFERISPSPQLKVFREGLRLFISHFLIKNTNIRVISEKDVEKLKSRAELVDKILLTRGGKTVF